MIDRLEIYFPFAPSPEIDPRSVMSVADQVIVEHTFAYFAQDSFKSGRIPLLTQIQVDRAKLQIRLKPRLDFRDSSGRPITIGAICESLESIFKGTRHLTVSKSMRKVECQQNDIVLHMNYIPLNLDAMFATPDFTVHDDKLLPINRTNLPATTGPYSVVKLEPGQIELKANPYFPSDLRANSIDNVTIHWTDTADRTFLKKLDKQRNHGIYGYGFHFSQIELDDLESRGFKVELFPSEWLVYLGFNKGISFEDRLALGQAIDEIRDESRIQIGLGQQAYSMSPQDRDFGFKESKYKNLTSSLTRASLSRPVKVGLFTELQRSPYFDYYHKALEQKLGNKVEFVTFDRPNVRKIFSEVDAHLLLLGISPGDPLTHFAFMQETKPNFAQVFSRDQIERLAQIQDLQKFNEEALLFEEKILKERLLIPLAHFPGVVALSDEFSRDEKLAWTWGIQSWTLRKRSTK